jgi:putative SOS response-associated peptidase YedK
MQQTSSAHTHTIRKHHASATPALVTLTASRSALVKWTGFYEEKRENEGEAQPLSSAAFLPSPACIQMYMHGFHAWIYMCV